MNYCSLDDAFSGYMKTDYNYQENFIQPSIVPHVPEPKVNYTCYDFREHLIQCNHCSKILAETRDDFYKQNDNTSNMIILFLILLLIWSMSSKN